MEDLRERLGAHEARTEVRFVAVEARLEAVARSAHAAADSSQGAVLALESGRQDVRDLRAEVVGLRRELDGVRGDVRAAVEELRRDMVLVKQHQHECSESLAALKAGQQELTHLGEVLLLAAKVAGPAATILAGVGSAAATWFLGQ